MRLSRGRPRIIFDSRPVGQVVRAGPSASAARALC
jgi:hypothetical protein